MRELPRRITLKYNKGQYSFNLLSNAASDTQLHDLAMRINAFQVQKAQKVIKVRRFDW